MSTPIWYRAQEWAADRFSFVQYPNISLASGQREPVRFFKHQMPLWKRIALIQFGLIAILLALPFLAFGLFLAYILIS